MRVAPSVADEETQLDDADMQTVNQEGSTSEIVEGMEGWTWDEVADEYSDGDGNDNVEDEDGCIVIT